MPGIKTLLAELNSNLDELEKTVQSTWEGLVEPLERLSDRVERTWGAVSHLKVGDAIQNGAYCTRKLAFSQVDLEIAKTVSLSVQSSPK